MSRKKTRLFLIDDHQIIIEGIRESIAEHPGFEVVGYAVDALKGVRELKRLKPDIVVLDLAMPNMNGVSAAHEIRKAMPAVKIVVYSVSAEPEHIRLLLKVGVSGYVLKDEPIASLIHALETAGRGERHFSKRLQDLIRRSRKDDPEPDVATPGEGLTGLSLREKEIFPLLADGKTSREIAGMLCISTKTVESHKYNIMAKLEAISLADLTKLAVKEGIIKIQ